jgi:hypothetical protein
MIYERGALDSEVIGVGDSGFAGVDCRGAPETIDDGMVADAVNKTFEDGGAATRKGMVGPEWGLEHGISFDVDFPVDFEGMGFGSLIRGVGVFSDPNGVEAMLVAVRDRVWRIGDGLVAEAISLPAGESIDEDCALVQCFDRVLLFRGEGVDVLEWNPQQTVEDGIGAFVAIAQSGAGTFTEPIPGAMDATVLVNRLFVPFDRDKIAVSDILDYTRYDSTMSQFRVNAGTADALVKLVPWSESSMIVFKENSIFLMTGLDGASLETTAAASDLTREYGLVGKDAWAKVGNDVWFLVEGAGVLSVGATINNATQARREPVSKDIEGYVRRIHWAYADKAVAGYDGARFYLAVPMDGATYNNAMLVFDAVTGVWQGYWEGDLLDAGWMVKTDYAGGRRMFVVNRANLEDWHANGAVLVLNEGFADELGGTEYEIADRLVTRAYRVADAVQRGRMLKLALDMETWRPQFTVKVLGGGAYEDVTVASGVTKSRTNYYQFGKVPWVETNVNDDHATAGREDYSVVVENLVPGSGVEVDKHQRRVEQVRVRISGVRLQCEVSNAQGRVVQRGVRVEGLEEKGMRRG